MRIHRRQALGSFLSLFALSSTVRAEETAVPLFDSTKAGDAFQYEIDLTLKGTMQFDRGEKSESAPLEAKAKHQFIESLEKISDGTSPTRATRVYQQGVAESLVATERAKRTLTTNSAAILVESTPTRTTHFSPNGPLTRDELSLVAEHFDTLAIPNLLPGKEVKIGETWEVRKDIAQAVCLLEGLIKTDLTGKLLEVKDGIATFSLDGSTEGIEHGATAVLKVTARGTFDIAKQRVTSLTWEQTDTRKQGPVSPASEAKATIKLTRTLVTSPKELTELRAKWPADSKIPELLTQLRHRDDTGFEMVYPRDWHIVVKNDKHLILRLLQHGELITQATISSWKPKADSSDLKAVVTEFVDATRKQPGWEPMQVRENGLVPTVAGKHIYRISAAGKQDGLDVVQSFYLLSGTAGNHKAVAFISTANTAEKVGTQDVALVAAIDLPTKK